MKTKKYDTVKAKFESHFIKCHNPIYERANFNQRKQLPGESVDDFITVLCGLVEHCEYGELQNEMIRDRIVVGLTDASWAGKLQLNPELTLETAITKAQQSEMVKKQQAVVRADIPYVDGIHKRKLSKDKSPTETKQEQCTRCGKIPSHARQNSPAKDSVCHRCKKKEHFQSQCKSKKAIDLISDIPEESEYVFLGTIHSNNSHTTE